MLLLLSTTASNSVPIQAVSLACTPTADASHNASFSNALCYQEAICEQGLAPKTIRTAEFSAVANYAYHLDSGKFGQFLQQHCTEKLGVVHILDDVIAIHSVVDSKSAANGDIAASRGFEQVVGDIGGIQVW